jgi:hypothetical protein
MTEVWVPGDPGDPGGWSHPNPTRVLASLGTPPNPAAPASVEPLIESSGAGDGEERHGTSGGGPTTPVASLVGDTPRVLLQRVGIQRVGVVTCIQRCVLDPGTGAVAGILGWMGSDLVLADTTPDAGMQLLRVACYSRLSAHDAFIGGHGV